MQAQQISPYATAATSEQEGIYTGPEHEMGAEEHVEHGSKKQSMLGKVKDKARKLKSKMHKPKSVDQNDESSSASSSEDESGSEPHQQVNDLGEGEKEIVSTPGLNSEAFQVIPDPHVNSAVGAAGVQKRFGQMSLGDESVRSKRQEEVPSAPERVSAGVTPYLARHNFGESPFVSGASQVEEGRNAEGKDIHGTPSSTNYKVTSIMDVDDNTPDISKTRDNTAALYTPFSETVFDAKQQKTLKDCGAEGAATGKDSVTASAAAGAGVLGVTPFVEKHRNVESQAPDASGSQKNKLEQTKERIFGHSPNTPKESQLDTTGGDKQIQGDESLTSKAVGTVTSFKDTVASKLGYGFNKNRNGEGPEAMQVDTHHPENKSVVQKIQDSITGVTESVTSTRGPGDKQQTPSQAVGIGENKSYAQKAYDAASGAKDAVAAKLGYGPTRKEDVMTDTATAQGEQKSYLQKMQETAVGAKDVVASKLGYGNRDVPASSEGAYNDDAASGAKDAVAAKLGYGPTRKEDVMTDTATAQGEQKSYLQKMQETAVGAKDVVASKLGYGNRDVPASSEGAYN
eukprot:c7245_g1_i1 orf=146-1855(+)